MIQRRFVVLDRDGTLIAERHYLSEPEQVELLPGTVKGLQLFQEMGLGLVVITNQSAIGRGFFDAVRLAEIHQRLTELLKAENIVLDGIAFCPHTPDDDCLCRKPRTALLDSAAKDLDFDPQACFVIGDKECDIELGRRVGATTFLVRTGHGENEAKKSSLRPDYIADDLWAASNLIQKILDSDE